ncbi:polyprenyl synthetase family protein [Streptomyces sp. JJ36]|uniref:polyprenyl synthetase family protein n=1 Tax=Streptomyces sp. JJ36 TaxID=2736645 RepID=UPI001F25533F|nr:polyprenyl synthetase family protein [Streptomyces sp. JJ36]MCF6524490.1 polyprenyl synthetase family protein [Streptomyces sp. JJ36]
MTTEDSAKSPQLDPQLAAELHTDLAAVENIIQESVHCDVALLHDASRHLVDAGGKRHRPLLTLLAARFGEHTDPDVLRAAAAVELVHMAALCHDDVMDEAPLRRGVPSVNARWGDDVALLAGDYLFSRSFLLMAALPSLPARLEVGTFAELVTGQIREMDGPGPDDDPLDHYLAVVSEKTASLMRTCVRIGALTAAAADAHVTALAEYGTLLGIAFQMSDDLLDVTGRKASSGKTPGTDLDQGVTSLPVLYALQGTDAESRRLNELLAPGRKRDGLSGAEREEALALLRAHPSLDRTRKQVWEYAERARAALAPLPDGPAKDGLASLCVAVAERDR